MLEFTNIYPMDAVYDTPEDVPEDVSTIHLIIQPFLLVPAFLVFAMGCLPQCMSRSLP